jgi:hypothetical protein
MHVTRIRLPIIRSILLDIENCIRRTALREDRLILLIFGDGSPDVFRVQENFGIERRLSYAFSNINSLHRKSGLARLYGLVGTPRDSNELERLTPWLRRQDSNIRIPESSRNCLDRSRHCKCGADHGGRVRLLSPSARSLGFDSIRILPPQPAHDRGLHRCAA